MTAETFENVVEIDTFFFGKFTFYRLDGTLYLSYRDDEHSFSVTTPLDDYVIEELRMLLEEQR